MFLHLGTKTFIRDNRNFDSTGVKLYIFIHNEVQDFEKNSTQPSSRQRESTILTKCKFSNTFNFSSFFLTKKHCLPIIIVLSICI
jgi:hypothetical protein